MIEKIKKESIWHKKCKLIYLYHYRKKKENSKWRVEDSSKELELSTGFISESLKLAKAISNNPILMKLNRETALKSLRIQL